MRRVFALFLVLVLICSVSCTPHEPAPTDPEAATTTTTSSTLSRDETELIEGDAAAVGTGSTTTTTTTTGVVDSPATTTTTSTTATTTTKKQPVVITTTTTTTTRQQETSGQTTTTTQPAVDGAEVAALVAKYINEYRNTPATVLPGLGKVATYRANELITNFAHTDGSSACNALQYGEYVDMTLYGCPESSNYYQGYNREAIGKGRWTGTADEIARSMAATCQASTKHWAYVGSDEYGYMAVGVAYDASCYTWYCCICMTAKDYGG